jgi:hypothetical protein
MEFDRTTIRITSDPLGHFQRAAVLRVIGDAGCAEKMIEMNR